MQKIKERIEFLRELIKYHDNLYQNYIPEISDAEYDELYYELVDLEEKYPEFADNESPTQKIHYDFVTELKKVKHEHQPMLSLDKTKDIEKIKEFIGNKEWIAMLKLDGLTCRLTYENGKLVRAETRGDGYEGEDITHNAMVLPSIPKRINYTDTLVIDGEVICDKQTFEENFASEYANCRNFAAGSIRLLDSAECEKRGLTFVAWDVIGAHYHSHTSHFCVRLWDKLNSLHELGFQTVPNYTWDDPSKDFNIFNLEDLVARFQQIANIAVLHYPIDGIVFKWDNIAEYEAAGRTEHHFRGGLAYKFYDDEYETELLDIEWSMGRTGVLSPVAIYKTIEIDGAECSRANLHNLNTVASILGESPMVGQKIWVYKANQIIPQVSKAEDVGDKLGADPIYFWNDPEIKFLFPPKECPICGAPTEKRESDSGTVELYCSSDQCPGKFVNRLDHFCGKRGLDIKGLSKATLGKLIDWGWVTRVKDLFYLYQREQEWIKKPGFGEKSVKKILDAIEEARHTTLEQYLSAISIPLIGKTYARELAKVFATYQEFRTAVSPDPITGKKPFDFTTLEGIGPEKHDAIMNFDYYEADRMVDMCIIDFREKEAQLENSGNAHSIEGLSFAITGKLKNFKNRDLLKAEIEAHGGKVVSSVSSKTNYLVNNDNTSESSKNKTAKSLGVPIITEEELMEMLK